MSRTPIVPFGKLTHAVPREPAPLTPETEATPILAPTPTGSREPVPPGVAPEIGVTPKAGYTPWPNRFWDAVAPTLEPLDVVVLGHLVRLTLGHKRETCQIGMKRLAERANAGVNTVRRAVHRLERRGLVLRVETVSSEGPNDERGVVWAVRLPPPETGAAPVKGATVRMGVAPDAGGMKGIETDHESDISILRKLAEQFRAAHPDGDVRARLLEFIAHEGWSVDEATLAEALRPLVKS